MTLRTRLPDALHYLVPKDNFHCQTPLKNVKFDLFGSEKCQLANLVVNSHWLIVIVLQATACKIRPTKVWYNRVVNTLNSLPSCVWQYY